MTGVLEPCIESKNAGSEGFEPRKWIVDVEVRVSPRATTRIETIRASVYTFLTSYLTKIKLPSNLEGWDDVPELASSVERIHLAESSCPSSTLTVEEISFQVHVYQPSENDSSEEYSSAPGEQGEDTMAASVCELPNRSWEGLWDSLIYADDIKLKLLDYIHATLVFSDAKVDFNLVSWNRVVLLHGPPGTGKTSLCRALAQKLSIRLSHRYHDARLLEINSHSLFSKWFSESGKLVQRLFNNITELVDDEDTFVVVLIDEVESLTAARAGAMAGTEPSDGLRVVNALLTQLDKLKHRKNVLVMSTSNLVKAIDCAFVDRADIVQYVDLPSREAIYEILRTSLMEIISKGIVTHATVPTLKEALVFELSAPSGKLFPSTTKGSSSSHETSKTLALRLLSLAETCRKQGMSGRALRRLPVLAFARYVGRGHAHADGSGAPLCTWLDGMDKVVADQLSASEHLA
ncbi:hypothetical protein HGRIS_009635 [Hohenbuehelia grisea]|uniref:AAA+ ATPase domain-containing protein n=1 Tax=Hohenbuehelia grisea TaxID=104357 RepID=A0ABR3J262_9AGAR